MKGNDMLLKGWVYRVGLFLLFLATGLLIFVAFSHFRPMLPPKTDPIARTGMVVVLLASALLARRSKRLEKYWQVLFAFFIASLAISLDLYLPLSRWVLRLLNRELNTPLGLAVDKLESSVTIIVAIIVLNRISGGSMASIYLKKGNIRKGLTIGLGTFVVVAAASFPLSEWLFGGRDLRLERVLPWIPWILLFVLGNAFNEELLFRGLFLRKLEPFFGRFCANLLIAIPFTLHHTGVEYTPEVLMFLAFLFPLALAWGYVMQNTDSLWGSVLFHAGMDIPLVLGIFSTRF